jgi:hypothetical protein
VYQAVATLVRELAPTVDERAACVEDGNWLQAAACDVTTAWTVSGTVTEELEQAEANVVLPVALDRRLWGRWAASRAPDLGDAGGRSVVLTQQARPGWVGDLAPWAGASLVALQVLGLPVHPALAAATRVAGSGTRPGGGAAAILTGAGGRYSPQHPPAAGPGPSPPDPPPPGPAPAPAPGPRPAPEPPPAAPEPARPVQPDPAQERPRQEPDSDFRNDFRNDARNDDRTPTQREHAHNGEKDKNDDRD